MGNLCGIFLCNIFSNNIEDHNEYNEYNKNDENNKYNENDEYNENIKTGLIKNEIKKSIPISIPIVNKIHIEPNYSFPKLDQENKSKKLHHYNNIYNNNDDDFLTEDLLYYELPKNFDLHCD